MAKRKTLMDDIHEALKADSTLAAPYQSELARLQLANQIAQLRELRGCH